jgi:hypothetical protein
MLKSRASLLDKRCRKPPIPGQVVTTPKREPANSFKDIPRVPSTLILSKKYIELPVSGAPSPAEPRGKVVIKRLPKKVANPNAKQEVSEKTQHTINRIKTSLLLDNFR